MDLFASHRNNQLPFWFCRTGHPLAAASNALSQSWTGLYVYAFPPIALLETTLIKIRENQAEEAIVLGPGTPFSYRWRARSPSCYHAEGISCRNTCLTRASSTTPTWRPSS